MNEIYWFKTNAPLVGEEHLVAENEFRVAKPEITQPRSFAEAKTILPIWAGHEKQTY